MHTVTQSDGPEPLLTLTINDTTMYVLAKLFSNVNVAFDPVSARMPCFGHVIPLVLNAFLWGQSAHSVVEEIGALDDDVHTMQKLHLWRKRGPI